MKISFHLECKIDKDKIDQFNTAADFGITKFTISLMFLHLGTAEGKGVL